MPDAWKWFKKTVFFDKSYLLQRNNHMELGRAEHKERPS